MNIRTCHVRPDRRVRSHLPRQAGSSRAIAKILQLHQRTLGVDLAGADAPEQRVQVAEPGEVGRATIDHEHVRVLIGAIAYTHEQARGRGVESRLDAKRARDIIHDVLELMRGDVEARHGQPGFQKEADGRPARLAGDDELAGGGLGYWIGNGNGDCCHRSTCFTYTG
jgi:hypothetical protein